MSSICNYVIYNNLESASTWKLYLSPLSIEENLKHDVELKSVCLQASRYCQEWIFKHQELVHLSLCRVDALFHTSLLRLVDVVRGWGGVGWWLCSVWFKYFFLVTTDPQNLKIVPALQH